jgi:Flp pilus assembly protein TadG
VRVRKRIGERGIAIYVSAVILVMAVPMIGLAIDGTMLYIIKSRLQGAVDGAALAAARALARGSDSAAQTTSAKAAAVSYVKLNYPDSYFFSQPVVIDSTTDVTVDLSVTNQRKISVTAHVTAPVLFMRYLNFNSTLVNANAQTVRRDVNIALVVDRSHSLTITSSCDPVKQAAINFVNKFANGRDLVSLTTFASSTHTDFAIANNFKSATPSVPTLLSNIVCDGSTSSAMGLWYGYDQLVGLAQPAALNIILFFTDGKPTGVNVNMPIANSSPCTSPNAGPPKYINGLYNTYTNVSQFFGILKPVNNGTVPSGDSAMTTDGNTGNGCNYMSTITDTSDFLGLPTSDIFGDKLDSGYQATTSNASGYIDLGNASNASAMAMNGAASAGLHIRNGDNEPATLPHSGSGLHNVIIYSIGLGNAPYPLSPDLLERISNDPRAGANYDNTKPAGLYVAAPTSADIDSAFAAVASEILRLAK